MGKGLATVDGVLMVGKLEVGNLKTLFFFLILFRSFDCFFHKLLTHPWEVDRISFQVSLVANVGAVEHQGEWEVAHHENPEDFQF